MAKQNSARRARSSSVRPQFRNSVEFNKMNVVAIVAEFDPARLPSAPGMPLLALAGQSVDKFDDGTAQVDLVGRVGRPRR